MKRLPVCVLAAFAPLATMAALGTGVAAAEGYTGQTYGDAASAVRAAGLRPMVVTRVGQQLPQELCRVTRAERVSGVAPGRGKKQTVQLNFSRVLFSLNCNNPVASLTESGNSVASPAGRAAKAASE